MLYIQRLEKKVQGLQEDKENSTLVHSQAMDSLNKMILFIKEKGLIEEFYSNETS